MFVCVWRGFPHVLLLFARLCYCGFPHVVFVLFVFVWCVSHVSCLVDCFTCVLCCLFVNAWPTNFHAFLLFVCLL